MTKNKFSIVPWLNRTTVTLVVILIIASFLIAFNALQQSIATNDSAIDSFEDCAAAGRPILESYPEQCIGLDGTRYIKQYDNATNDY